MAANEVVSRRAERKAAVQAKRDARWQKRYDKAPVKRQARMDATKARKAARLAKRGERIAKRDERKGLLTSMKEKRNDPGMLDADREFFKANAKQRNMSLRDYYAKYVK